MKKRIFKFIAAFLVIGYVIWIFIPFDDSIKIYDSVGLSDSEKVLIVDYVGSIDSFPESTVAKLRGESFFTPWSRGELFVSISGNKDSIEVMAGFNGGPLYGGGRIITGQRVNGRWVFSSVEGSHWKS